MSPACVDADALHYADHLSPGDVVSWPQATGEPVLLTQALVAQREDLTGVGIFVGMTSSDTLQPEHARHFALRGLNGAGTNRRLTARGVLDIVPAHVSTVPALLRAGLLRVDVALVQVRRHELSGMYSLGVVADYTRALIRSARLVIAHLNEALPRTAHDALVSGEEIDILVRGVAPVLEMPDPVPRDDDVAVARVVASLIPDRATVQLGIGALPVAVARALEGHRDLGIHSGVIFDGIADLVERGVVTNACKGRDAGATVTGCLFGTRRLYRHADLDSDVHLRAVTHTHDPHVMAGIERLHAVNSAVEVDLTGQVNAETAGGVYLGAVGGQADFVRGAARSAGGRSIIALPATTPDGRHSRIVPALQGPVTTPRSDADVVVTQFGYAELKGRSLAERAHRLIAIADPRFRESLERSIREPGSGVPAATGLSAAAFGAVRERDAGTTDRETVR